MKEEGKNDPRFAKIVDMLINAINTAETSSLDSKKSGEGGYHRMITTPTNVPTPGSELYSVPGVCPGVPRGEGLESFEGREGMKMGADTLKSHSASVNRIGARVYECMEPGCSFKVTQKRQLTQHLATFHSRGIGVNLYFCTQDGCQYKSKNRGDLKRHLANVHDIGKKKVFECPMEGCNFKANQRSHLKQHAASMHKIALTCNEIKETKT
jgi:uncharacterized Zn-finger protein